MDWRHYSAILPVALILICAALVFFLGGEKTYENRFLGLSVLQPAGWQVHEDGSNTVYFQPPSPFSKAMVAITVAESDSNKTLSELSYAMRARYVRALKGVSIINISEANATIFGTHALMGLFVAEHDSDSGRAVIYTRHYFLKNNKTYYIISFSSSSQAGTNGQDAEKYARDFERMAASFRII